MPTPPTLDLDEWVPPTAEAALQLFDALQTAGYSRTSARTVVGWLQLDYPRMEMPLPETERVRKSQVRAQLKKLGRPPWAQHRQPAKVSHSGAEATGVYLRSVGRFRRPEPAQLAAA